MLKSSVFILGLVVSVSAKHVIANKPAIDESDD